MQERRHNDEAILSDLAVLYARFDAMDEKLDRIYEQTLKTNGRVTGHDNEISVMKIELAENRGKAKISGAFWGVAGSAFVGIIVLILNKVF
jgi:hypothetical protein